MNQKQLDLELNKHLEEVLSSKKDSLQNTKEKALSSWNYICNRQKELVILDIHKVIIEHYNDGKVIIVFYNTDSSIHEKFSDYCGDYELLNLINIIAEKSDIEGKSRLSDNGVNRELYLYFK